MLWKFDSFFSFSKHPEKVKVPEHPSNEENKKNSDPAPSSEEINEDDAQVDKNGVKLLIDAMSYQYLVGAEIDYQEGIDGAQFVIKNPNATSTCGCGSSFSA